jgi:hypothetical protein
MNTRQPIIISRLHLCDSLCMYLVQPFLKLIADKGVSYFCKRCFGRALFAQNIVTGDRATAYRCGLVQTNTIHWT